MTHKSSVLLLQVTRIHLQFMAKHLFLFSQFIKMGLAQLGPQKLERRPEPEAITASEAQVLQYEAVLGTKLAIAYAVALETLYRCLPDTQSPTARKAADLASGPGYFTIALAQYLQFSTIDGFDLSPRMVASANATSQKLGLQYSLKFHQQDIRDLHQIPNASLDLTTFTDAAHHLPSPADVQKVLQEMDRVTRPEGLIFVMDLVRLRTAKLTESYVETLGADYRKMGLPVFLEDFRHSMYAAWSPEELARCIPQATTERVWVQLVPPFLPSLQILVGLPVGRTQLYLRNGLPWTEAQHPVEKSMRLEWRLARFSITTAMKKKFLKKL